jgi:hypothetical protein
MDSLLALRPRLALATATLVLAVTAASGASADCSNGADCLATVDTNTVQVLPDGTARKCGGPIAMLRQNVETGEVVQPRLSLATRCLSARSSPWS